jgi:signal transduction histidine kinase
MSEPSTQKSPVRERLGLLFMWLVVVCVLSLLTYLWLSGDQGLRHHGIGFQTMLFWIAVLAAVELLPVPVTKQLQITLGFPVLLAVAMFYRRPEVVATVALLGSFDSRELKREIAPVKALFNRSQLALTMLISSLVFHSIAAVGSPLAILIPAVLAATVAHYVINVVFVCVALSLLYSWPVRKVLEQLRVGDVRQFLLNFVGLAFIGAVIAKLFASTSWSVIAFVAPLVFARQMFFRTLALEDAGKELKDREQVLRALSNRMAEERQDERMQIAGYLHDDLAQMLFRLSLQAEMARKRLARQEFETVDRDLEGILQTKQDTADMVRALIRDLHRSPIGRKGLAEAIQSFGEDMSKGGPTEILTDVVEVSLPPPIQLLIYQISREAAMNALKHAEAEHIFITLVEGDDGVELQIRDDGKGFDTSAPPPEGHFGSVMMRERAMVAGGTFRIESEPGQGTGITVTFPRVWVEEGTLLDAQSNGQRAPSTETPVTDSAAPSDSEEGAPAHEQPSQDGPPTHQQRSA